MRTFFIKTIFLCLPFLSLTLHAQSSEKLIIRCDDIGISHAVNQAFERIAETGMPVSVAVIVNGPWFPEAVQLLKRYPNVSVGVHLTANSEWEYLRWGPILGRENVASLVDKDGYFKNEWIGNWQVPANMEELEKEFRAQIQKAQDAGLSLSFINGHMGVDKASDVHKQLIRQLGKEFDLLVSEQCDEVALQVNQEKYQDDSMLKRVEKEIRVNTGKMMLLVIHPGLDTIEMSALHLKGEAPSTEVAVSRNAETKMLTAKSFSRMLSRNKVQLINYSQLAQ
ncbi:ChbG/HpnK family deacetylase [Limibacter armeniacum]|uniref:carbohydrate deacetylase n=1 Tax=Limibacter armeniacum TaxID=466084 RepID=UPI002FE5D2B9